jgi:hypothetical protein
LAGIASELANELAPGSQAGEILGWISFGLGLASLGAGMAAGAKAAVNAGRKMASAFSQGLSGKGAGKAGQYLKKGGKGAKAAAKKANAPVETVPDEPWQLHRAKKDNFVSEINEERAKGFYKLVESNKSASQAAAESEMLYEEFGPVGAGRKVTHVFFAKTKGRGERIYLLEDSKQRVCKVLQAGGHLSDGQTNTMMKTAKSIDTTRM